MGCITVFPNGLEREKFNINSIHNICSNFKMQFISYFATKYKYDSLDFIATTCLMKHEKFIDEIPQSLLGLKEDLSFEVEKNYLYDKKVFDSSLEQEILKLKPNDQVLVFGKIPKKSIRVPLYTGGTSSPDFIYAIKSKKETILNLILEAKSTDLRESEIIALESQKKYFEQFDDVKWEKVTSSQKVKDCLYALIYDHN